MNAVQALGVQEFSTYALVIDARSPREFAEDHVPGAVNLPVVNDTEYAEVGTRHRDDKHGAYLVGVEYALRNIADQIKPLIAKHDASDRFLVYCFRGGKRSRLWADNLKTIGFHVDVLAGGWKRYRQWVREMLDGLAPTFDYRVVSGTTGAGKTRLLAALSRAGEQVIDLEALARHRGSLLGALPGIDQPTQKLFDTELLDVMRRLDRTRPVWVEAESKKIGNVQLPQVLFEAMHRSDVVRIESPMAERVRLWREDYPQFAAAPDTLVALLQPLRPLVGSVTLQSWSGLASAGEVDALFESVMRIHYDPCYERSTRRNYGEKGSLGVVHLDRLDASALDAVAATLARDYARR